MRAGHQSAARRHTGAVIENQRHRHRKFRRQLEIESVWDERR